MHPLLRSALVVALALAPALAFAESSPSCPVPSGVTCMSTPDVYRATNNADKVTSKHQGEDAQPSSLPALPPAPQPSLARQARNGAMQPVAYRPSQYAQLSVQGDALVITNNDADPSNAAPPSAPSSEPYRVPAQIMQVYIGAWQDEQGDLHLPQQVVTEIEPRHWSIGAPSSATNGGFHLLELPGDAAKDSQSATVPANTAHGSSGM